MQAPQIITSQKSAPDNCDTSMQFSARSVRNVVDGHRKRADDIIEASKERIAAYMTRWWEERRGNLSRASAEQSLLSNETWIEVNRLWSLTNTIASALYPTAARVALMPDYSGKGNAPLAEASLNDWLVRHQVQEQILAATTQAVVVGAAGFKVGYEPGTARPADRVTLDVIPAWEMVLDAQVTNRTRERYRGTLTWMPKAEAEARWGVKLVGRARKQPTSGLGDGSEPGDAPPPGAVIVDGQSAAIDSASDGEFVEVLEFYNLVDPMRTRRGHTFLGRFEIWVLNQPEGLSDRPIRVEAMPSATTAGKPLAPLRPLIFASHPVYPYQALSILERVMPQVRELNVFRTINAMQARRSASRIYGKVEGAVTQDQSDAALSGEDSIVFKIDAGYKGNPKDALFALDPPREDPATRSHIAALQQEFTWATGQSPNSRGEITEATKYEVQAANRFTEMELKRYATQLYAALGGGGGVAELALRMMILAMQDVGDSMAGYSDEASPNSRDIAPDVKVGPVGAVRAKEEVDVVIEDIGQQNAAPTEDGPAEAETRATVAPAEPSEAAADPAMIERAVEAEVPAKVVAVKPFPVRVNGQIEMVTVADLDADFEYQYLDGVRTPLKEDARKEAQLQLSDKYLALWEKAKTGDVLARAQMESLADAFELPSSWRPKSLEEAERQQAAAKKPTAPPPDMVEAGTPEPPAPAAPPPGPVEMLTQARDLLQAGKVEEASQLLLPLAKSMPELGQMLGEAARSPDPAAALLQVVNALLSQAEAPPAAVEEPPAEPAEVAAPPVEPSPADLNVEM